MKVLPLSEVKARLSELVEDAARTHERVSITRHGQPTAVLLSLEDLESLEETLFWASRPDTAQAVTEADALRLAADGTRDDVDDVRNLIAQRRSASA